MASKKVKPKNKKISDAMKEAWKRRRSGIKPEGAKARTTLSFIGDMMSNRTSVWTMEKAQKLIECIKNDMFVEEYNAYKWDQKKAAKATGISEGACNSFYAELKKAYAEGMSLEQMFKSGRPFRTGQKVLA